MRRRVETSGKALMALICSSLMVFQPSFAAHSELSADSKLIAVAKLTGTAERNGRPLLNGSIVSSGDSLRTGGNSALLLTTTPEERLWLGPNTTAKLTKEAGNVAVALERGTLGFQTRGRIEVTLEQHNGLAIRSRADLPAVAQLSFANGQEVQVRVQEGSLELVEGSQSIPLQAEPTRFISLTGTHLPTEASTNRDVSARAGQAESTAGTVTGTVVDSKLFAVSGANITLTNAAGTSLKTVSDPQGKFTFNDVPPGTYTLNVAQAGFPNYEQKDVVVTSGKESSLYVQLGGGGGTKNKGLLIGVIVGVGAAAGIGAAVAAGGHSSSTSPSTP
jgi:hypothetical protein